MDKQDLKIRIQKYQDGEASAEERAELLEWYNYYAINKPRQDFPSDIWFRQQSSLDAILGSPIRAEDPQIKPINYKRSKWRYISIAASVALLIGIGSYFYSNQYSAQQVSSYANDVEPGKNSAVLTLANGKKISLNEAKTGVVIDASKLHYDDGTSIFSGSAGHQETPSSASLAAVNTPRGGTYQVILPDGTKVWLNAASSLKFPFTFKGAADREVQLDGEAYFEVEKDKNHPFIVQTNHQKVEVLGTHFNISAYEDDPIAKTTLLSGSVKVSSAKLRFSSLLKPGQQSISNEKSVKIISVDTEEAMAWKEGIFMFNGQDLDGIMKQVARWYDVEVVFEDQTLKTQAFKGTISRFKKISQLLQVLEAAGSVHFKIEGRRITVMQ